jgi:hypothetical protein
MTELRPTPPPCPRARRESRPAPRPTLGSILASADRRPRNSCRTVVPDLHCDMEIGQLQDLRADISLPTHRSSRFQQSALTVADAHWVALERFPFDGNAVTADGAIRAVTEEDLAVEAVEDRAQLPTASGQHAYGGCVRTVEHGGLATHSFRR